MSVESADVREELAELRERVETLESIVTQASTADVADRYDDHVIAKLEQAGESVPTRTVLRWYREAGVKNQRKIKTRLQDLRAEGLIEPVGKTAWRYCGPQQATLGVEP